MHWVGDAGFGEGLAYVFVPDDDIIRKLADQLDLKTAALPDLAHKGYEPAGTSFESLGTAAMIRSNWSIDDGR